MNKKKEKHTNILKATIILRLKDGAIVHGEGTVEGTKTPDGMALLTARLFKALPKKKRKSPRT